MKKPIFIWFHLLLLLFAPAIAQVDTVLIRQFNYSDYLAGETNYIGIAGPDGVLYFGNSDGVLIYDGSEWKKIIIGKNSGVAAMLFSGDTLYIGGTDEIGYIVHDDNDSWVYTSFIPQIKNPHLIDDIWQIVKTKDGIYFESYSLILFYNGKSFTHLDITDSYIFNLENELLVSSFYEGLKVLSKDSVISSLATPALDGDAVFGIISSGREKEYLIFTAASGAFKLTTNPLEISYWDSPISSQIKKDGFYSGVEFQDSLIICTTWDNGVLLFSKNGDIKRRINIDKGLPNKDLRQLFVDELNNIWIPANSGIYQLRLSIENQVGDFVAKTVIKGVKTENGNVDILENIYNPQYVAIDFTTPGFSHEELEYSFYLEGLDDNWTDWSKIYRKEYSNLSGGKYSFRIRARVIGTEYIADEAELGFSIKLPWYKRPYTYFLLALAMGGLIILLMRLRTRQLKKSKVVLEQMVNTRTKELLAEREKLKSSNEELQTTNAELDNFVYRSSHDLIAPLKSLRGLMSITKLETNNTQILDYISMMESSVHKLEKFINNIMEYSINVKSDIQKESIDLSAMLDEIHDDIQYFDKYPSIEFKRELVTTELNTDPKRLKIVLNNLITNAVKYHNMKQEHPWIKIKGRKNEKHYIIEIQDNGLGIDPEHHDKIFDMFYRASADSDGSGLGLYIVKDTVEKLHGSISLTSAIEKGTSFILKFPLK